MIQRNGKISHALGLEELILVNGNTTQRNLQIECDPYQHIHDIFHRTRTSNTKMYIETLKTQNCQSNTMGKQSRRYNSPRHQTIPQSYHNHNSAHKNTEINGAEDRAHRNKPLNPRVS